MLVRIASAEWLRKVADVKPTIIEEMIRKFAGKTIEVTLHNDWTQYTIDQINALEISLPTCKNMLYEGEDFIWSTLMFAETEEFNNRPPLNVGDVLSFIDEGGQ